MWTYFVTISPLYVMMSPLYVIMSLLYVVMSPLYVIMSPCMLLVVWVSYNGSIHTVDDSETLLRGSEGVYTSWYCLYLPGAAGGYQPRTAAVACYLPWLCVGELWRCQVAWCPWQCSWETVQVVMGWNSRGTDLARETWTIYPLVKGIWIWIVNHW